MSKKNSGIEHAVLESFIYFQSYDVCVYLSVCMCDITNAYLVDTHSIPTSLSLLVVVFPYCLQNLDLLAEILVDPCKIKLIDFSGDFCCIFHLFKFLSIPE